MANLGDTIRIGQRPSGLGSHEHAWQTEPTSWTPMPAKRNVPLARGETFPPRIARARTIVQVGRFGCIPQRRHHV